jgi:uncharacterized protein (DUF1778 family)
MVAQSIDTASNVDRDDDEFGPLRRIVLSERDGLAILEAMERPAKSDPKMARLIQRAREFDKRHGVESVW